MYNVLISDDEPSVLEGLQIIIDWSQYGFRIADIAKNGREALEKVKRDRYNLLITDIRMPVLDGIELIKAVRQENPHIRILVISGYSDFQYAKKSLEYGVKGYLLKPIDEVELTDNLIKIKNELDTEIKNRLFDKENMKIVRDKFLYDFVNSSLTNSEIEEKESLYGFNLSGSHIGLALLEIDNFTDLLENGVEDAKLTMFSVRNILEETFEDKGEGIVYQDTQAVLGLLFLGEENKLTFDYVKEKLEHLLRCIRNYLKINVTIGYGGTADNYQMVKQARKKAKLAIERKVIAQGSSVVDYKQVDSGENRIPMILWDPKELLTAVECEQFETIKKETGNLLDELENRYVSMEVVRAVLYNVLFGMLKIIKTYNGDSNVIFNDKNDFRNTSMNTKQVAQWLVSVCTATCNYVAELKRCKSESVISHIIRYINDNFEKDLSLKFIAGVFYMNPVLSGKTIQKHSWRVI